MKNKKKLVYVAFSDDILHEGHFKILKKASSLGNVVVGLLTDEAIASYKTLPYYNFKQRELIIKNMKYVKRVVKQNMLDYTENLKLLKPHYVVHGDDWKIGADKTLRKNVLKALKEYGGRLIEIPYTKGVSSEALVDSEKIYSTTPKL